jgi:hypothetical protein
MWQNQKFACNIREKCSVIIEAFKRKRKKIVTLTFLDAVKG